MRTVWIFGYRFNYFLTQYPLHFQQSTLDQMWVITYILILTKRKKVSKQLSQAWLDLKHRPVLLEVTAQSWVALPQPSTGGQLSFAVIRVVPMLRYDNKHILPSKALNHLDHFFYCYSTLDQVNLLVIFP